MRIGIRQQLAALVLVTALIPLIVLAVVTWVNNRNFVVNVTSQELTLTASLKAAQISSDLLLIQATCATIVTRILLQQALKEFYQGNKTAANWDEASSDILGALASGGFSSLLQTTVFSRNTTSTAPDSNVLIRETAASPGIELPDTINCTNVTLGQDRSNCSYPVALYPNITYTTTSERDPMDPNVNATAVNAYQDFPLSTSSALLLGPLQINSSYALVSLTLPIVDNLNSTIVLAFMTVIAAASSLIAITQSPEGLATTGITLLVGPDRHENQFWSPQRPATANYTPPLGAVESAPVQYVFPPYTFGKTDRHQQYNYNLNNSINASFAMDRYPAVVDGFGIYNGAINNAGSILSTKNENNISVAVGYARPQSSLVQWLLVVEQSHNEAWVPITKLRSVVLACVFGTIGLVLLVVLPVAHLSVRPITRLRDATKRSIAPPGYSTNGSIHSERIHDGEMSGDEMADLENRTSASQHPKKGFFIRLRNLTSGSKGKSKAERNEDDRRRVFKIPAKVQDRKHFITDELTELTETFNSMSDELMLQYQSLEDKVADRTRELEASKKSAEAANQSKTLFIANISHELKTPLNGILGMVALCMGETDLAKIQRSLGIAYKSGDLLLHLLNDLLTFSKNQIGQQLTLDESEFRLIDIKTQLSTIFMKQVQEGKANFSVKFIGTNPEPDIGAPSDRALPALGPHGTGRLKDMYLFGDVHRILQIIINLVGNSLKFTPTGGKVEVRIKCLGEAEATSEGSRNSMGSKQSSSQTQQIQQRQDSSSNNSQLSRKPSNPPQTPVGTALMINPMDPKNQPQVQLRDRSPTSHVHFQPSHTRILLFEIEVEDTGPGIPKDFRERVFEPFMQGDLGLSRKHGGTGLGLSICSQLAGLMGGSITLVHSEEGVGSTFSVKIPLRYTKSRTPSTSSSNPSSIHHNSEGSRSSQMAHSEGNSRSGYDKDSQPRLVGLSQPFFAAPPTPSPGREISAHVGSLDGTVGQEPGSKLRVLVAEDNLVNQEVVTRMLKLESIYDVVIAKDGQEAYDMVKDNMSKSQYFDLIFMDIQMPNLDGLQSTRLIRQMGYSAPIVALTAFAEESNVKECHEAGMDMFLSKPIRRPALKQVLKKFATIPEEPETSSLLARKGSTALIEPRHSTQSNHDNPKNSSSNPNGRPPLQVPPTKA